MATSRIISSDSHVSVQHDDVKAHLATRLHDEYDAALMQAYREMLGGNAAKANQGGNEIKHASWGRPGYSEPHERLRDMDIDGVDIEVLYCEVSAYRYLYLLADRRGRGDARVQRHAARLRVGRPEPPVVTYQVPIHDIDLAVTEIERVAAMGGKSLQLPVFPAELGQPDYFHERYDRMWAAISASGLPVCCHIGLNTALDQLADRDPTPRLAWTLSCMPLSACEALGMWLLTGILTRYPELKIVFVEPGLGVGRGLPGVPRRHGAAPGLRVPGARRRAAELLLPPQHGDDVHRRARPGAPPAPRARRARTCCGRATTRTRCRRGRSR